MYFVALFAKGVPSQMLVLFGGTWPGNVWDPGSIWQSDPLVSVPGGFYDLSCESESCEHDNVADGTDVTAGSSASWNKGEKPRVWMRRRLHGRHKVWICWLCILSSAGFYSRCLSWWCRLSSKTEPHFTQHLTAGLIYSKLMAALTSVQDFAKVSLTRSAQSLDDLQLYAIWSACVSVSVCVRVCVCLPVCAV